MQNETKANKALIISLAIGIAMLLVGIAMIVVGMILNNSDRISFNEWVAAQNFSKGEKPSYQAAWYIYLLEMGGAAFFLGSMGNIYYFFQNKYNLKKMNVKQMAVISVFAALSVILYYFAKFNIAVAFPSWLDFQFSDVPALLVSFMYGPVSGCLVVLVRFMCKLPATSTVGVGELADVIIGITLCVVSGLIYKKHKSIKGAFAAMGAGMGSATIAAAFANWLILIPAYVNLANFPMPGLVGTMNALVGGGVNESNFMVYYIFVSVIPFNLVRYAMVLVITAILYKRLHMLIEMITGKEEANDVSKETEELETE